MLMVEFAANPLDQGVTVADFTSEAIDFITRSGLDYKVGPMGTTVEGDLGDVMALIAECLTVLSKSSERIVFTLQGDLRKTTERKIDSAIEADDEFGDELVGNEITQ